MHVSHQGARDERRPGRRRGRGERGYVLVMFALLLVPLLLMAGLAVDVGSWYSRASDIQKATDAAALAGVVWLPDEEKAEEYALAAAKRNGFDDADANIEVDVTKSPDNDRRLRVRITDDRVGSFFYEAVSGNEIDITRRAAAEYVLAVPLGSPRNYFGTGTLIGDNPELLYQSVNPYCTSKINGDRHQSGHMSSTTSLSSCPDAASQEEYRPEGYELYIEVPEKRPSSIEVRLYDARYSSGGVPIPLADCYGWGYDDHGIYSSGQPTLSGAHWHYNSGSPGSASSWSWQSSSGGHRHRYTIKNNGCIDGADSFRKSGNEDYTFTLYSADSTPLTDSDNPLVPASACAGSLNPRTFTSTTAFDSGRYIGSDRWNRFCTITTSMPSGRYILRVRNHGARGNFADGSNQWGVVARYTSASGLGLCDGRNDALCPRVYGKRAISVYANTKSKTASFYLAEIDAIHAGKKLRLELWDPGEGGKSIQIKRPTGTNSWTPHPFSWKATDGSSGSGTSLDVTSSKFNGDLVTIDVDLGSYAPPADNNWWQISYEFTSGDVTDRTTWSAEIIGDPVHLVEEE